MPSGHVFVNQRLRAQFGESGWAQDQMSGIGYLFALRELATDIDKKWKSVLKKLEAMREALINRNALICNVTLDAAELENLQAAAGGLPVRAARKEGQACRRSTSSLTQKKEGLTIPAQVNYVGKGANLYDLGYEYDGSAEVITGYLRLAYLWEKIRVQGGAYGGFCRLRRCLRCVHLPLLPRPERRRDA